MTDINPIKGLFDLLLYGRLYGRVRRHENIDLKIITVES
jgi:hypothetical protein